MREFCTTEKLLPLTGSSANYLNLETAVGRKKDVDDIGVHGEIQKVVGTSVVMKLFYFVGCA